MSEQGTAPVGQPSESVTPAGEKESVAYETHKRLLDEKKRVQSELEVLRQKDKEREEADAKKRGDYETLLQLKEAELAKAREEAEKERLNRAGLEEAVKSAQKQVAVIDALGGQIDPKWHRFIDVDKVIINPETGKIDPLSVAKYAEELKRDWPEMLKKTSVLPAGAPQGGSQSFIKRDDWLKLSSKEMRKWKFDQILD
jgi:hypothetical protein